MKTPTVSATDADGKPKSTWEKLLAMTPVVMTVVATLLAGLSSSEMTKAQYYRSLAAQNQAKVGDQWALFQAKRLRGTNHELTVKLLYSMTDATAIVPEHLQLAADRLAGQLRNGAREARVLAERVGTAKLGTAGDPLRQAADRLVKTAEADAAKADALQKRFAATLADPTVREALTYLNSDALPRPEGPAEDTAPPRDSPIGQALQQIRERKTEQEMEPTLAAIREPALLREIAATEDHLKALDDAGKPVADRLKQVDRLVTQDVLVARAFARAVNDVRAALSQMPDEAEAAAVRQTVAALADSAAVAKSDANELNNNLTAAHLRYNGRRYEQEAADNQWAAGLYEIQVRKNGWDAERHRRRSAYFFYGMLAAQAGVTIASLALAVRMRSLLWALASTAGAAAIAIAAYVYFYV